MGARDACPAPPTAANAATSSRPLPVTATPSKSQPGYPAAPATPTTVALEGFTSSGSEDATGTPRRPYAAALFTPQSAIAGSTTPNRRPPPPPRKRRRTRGVDGVAAVAGGGGGAVTKGSAMGGGYRRRRRAPPAAASATPCLAARPTTSASSPQQFRPVACRLADLFAAADDTTTATPCMGGTSDAAGSGGAASGKCADGSANGGKGGWLAEASAATIEAEARRWAAVWGWDLLRGAPAVGAAAAAPWRWTYVGEVGVAAVLRAAAAAGGS